MSGVRVPAPPPFRARLAPGPARLRRLEPAVRRALRGPCRLPAGARALVALSGGADSVALLIALHRVAPEFGLSVHAAHLHHGLRGREADRDLAFARALCARLGVPLRWARWDTRARMRRRGLGGQAGLRTLRREFLAAAARRARATAIATAHTADDQLETVIMRLLRGAGLAGLAGMRPRRGRWIKPLLEATRAEIEADLRRAGEDWREDRSNGDPAYLRNRVRHRVIPALLAALGPAGARAGARAALARRVGRAAAEAGGAARALERWAGRVLSRHARIQGGEIALDPRGMRLYPSVARHMILRRFWATGAPGRGGLTHRHLEQLSRLVEGTRGGARVALPGGAEAVRERGWVRLEPGAQPRPGQRRRGASGGWRSTTRRGKGILTPSIPPHGGR
ncbi:MAG TPA: tRNA lysidine(34) synthetase TilS [Candidatus Eisenbacteria bacterium]